MIKADPYGRTSVHRDFFEFVRYTNAGIKIRCLRPAWLYPYRLFLVKPSRERMLPERLCGKSFPAVGQLRQPVAARIGDDAEDGAAGDQGVGFRQRIIHRERSPAHTRNSVMRHHRLGTVLSRTNGDAELVEDHAHIIGMHPLDIERYDRTLVRRRTVNPQAGDSLQPFGSTQQQRPFMRLDLRRIELPDIAHRFAQRAAARLLPPRLLPRIKRACFSQELRVLVALPTVLMDEKHALQMCRKLSILYLANADMPLDFLLLSDFTDAQAAHAEGDADFIA